MKKELYKISAIFVLVLLLFGAGIVQGGANNDDSNEMNSRNLLKPSSADMLNSTSVKTTFGNIDTICGPKDEFMDQEQPISSGQGFNINYGQYVAQSFKPSVTRLSKVQLKLFKYNGAPTYDLEFSVREQLDGVELATVIKTPGEISNGWNEFDFSDLEVEIDKTYYLVCQGDGGQGNDPIYCWYCTDTNPYDRGMVHIYNYGNWHSVPAFDCCFRTYYTNSPPYIPTIEGQTNGEAGVSYVYTSSTTDPDDDQLYYLFDWGDNQTSGLLGPYDSGDSASSSHSWEEQGTYIIRVKAFDTCNGESDWVELEVTMPVNQPIQYPLFLRFLERFPNAFPILRHLMGL